jgi:hypothetical protein
MWLHSLLTRGSPTFSEYLFRSAHRMSTYRYPPWTYLPANIFLRQFASVRFDGGYQGMQRSAHFTLAPLSFSLVALAACSGSVSRSVAPVEVVAVSSSIVTRGPSSTVLSSSPSAAAPTAVEPVVDSSVSSASPLPTSALLVEDQPDLASAAFAHDNFEATGSDSKTAVEFIRALIASNHSRAAVLADEHSVRLMEDWGASLSSMPDARVIEAVVLSTASGRSIVAVRIASPILAGGLVSEPIAYLVELSESADGAWLVTGMTFA